MAKTKIRVNILRGTDTVIKAENGKRIGPLLIFKSANPEKPVAWTGEKGYSLYDVKRKTEIFFYDSTKERLVSFSELQGMESVNVKAILSSNLITAMREADKQMLLFDSTGYLYKMGAIGIIGFAVVIMILYLIPFLIAK